MVHLPETKKELKNLNGNTDFIYRCELDKACFNHDMTYGKSKDLTKRTQSKSVLRHKAFKIASDPKYDGYQRDWLQWFTSLLIKSLAEVVLALNQVINLQMNFTSRSLENVREEKFIHPLKAIFGVSI